MTRFARRSVLVTGGGTGIWKGCALVGAAAAAGRDVATSDDAAATLGLSRRAPYPAPAETLTPK